MNWEDSARRMRAMEQAYIEDLRKQTPDLREDVLAAMSALYQAGWKDCWELGR